MSFSLVPSPRSGCSVTLSFSFTRENYFLALKLGTRRGSLCRNLTVLIYIVYLVALIRVLTHSILYVSLLFQLVPITLINHSTIECPACWSGETLRPEAGIALLYLSLQQVISFFNILLPFRHLDLLTDLPPKFTLEAKGLPSSIYITL